MEGKEVDFQARIQKSNEQETACQAQASHKMRIGWVWALPTHPTRFYLNLDSERLLPDWFISKYAV